MILFQWDLDLLKHFGALVDLGLFCDLHGPFHFLFFIKTFSINVREKKTPKTQIHKPEEI